MTDKHEQEAASEASPKSHHWLRQALEIGPTILFFYVYFRNKDEVFEIAGREYSGFIFATLIFIPVLLLCMGLLWYLTGKLSRMQVFTAIMVVFFGALTAWFNDERFYQIKTTIVYLTFAGLLGIGLLRGQSYLAWVMADAIPMQPTGWMILTRRMTAVFAALALANEIVWRNFSVDVWFVIENFAFPVALFAFLFWQIFALQQYMDVPEEEK